MFDIETDYWWYVGLHQLVLYFLGQVNTGKDRLEILRRRLRNRPIDETVPSRRTRTDGPGHFSGGASILASPRSPHSSSGIDFRDPVPKCPIRRCRISRRGRLPGSRAKFAGTLCEMHRVLRRGGHLILNLPAYNSLRSRHDLAQHILHRFRADELGSLLSEVGFQPHLCTYRNTFLFPVAAIVRLLKRRSAPGHDTLRSDLKPLPHPINAALTRVLALENSLIKKGLHLPFGLSVFGVASKPA